MAYIKFFSALLGVFISLNALLAILLDETTPLGTMYFEAWKWIAGGSRSANYDPFLDDKRYVVWYFRSVDLADRNYRSINSAMDNAYSANYRNDGNSSLPRGALVFARDEAQAYHFSRVMTSASVREELVEGVFVDVTSAKYERFASLDDFCAKFVTFEPQVLCQ